MADDRPGKAHHAYTRLSVALFLGWTKKDGDRLKPNYACAQAFAALELIERKLLKESDFRGQFQRPVFAGIRTPISTRQRTRRFCAAVFRRWP